MSTMEEWMVNGMELVGMVKLTVLINRKNLFSFASIWKPFLDFVPKTKQTKNETLILDFSLLEWVCCYRNGLEHLKM